MAIPNWLVHAAFLAVLVTLILFTYLGLELDIAGFWPSDHERG
jgi:hypothetical protein